MSFKVLRVLFKVCNVFYDINYFNIRACNLYSEFFINNLPGFTLRCYFKLVLSGIKLTVYSDSDINYNSTLKVPRFC